MKIATGLFLAIAILVVVMFTGCDKSPQPVVERKMPVAPCVAKSYMKPAGYYVTILCPNGSIWILNAPNWLKISDGPQ